MDWPDRALAASRSMPMLTAPAITMARATSVRMTLSIDRAVLGVGGTVPVSDQGGMQIDRMRHHCRPEHSDSEHVLVGGAQLAEAGAAPEAGRLASYGAFRAVLAGGRASTGRKISDLHGAAADRAARAKFGLGPKASGGFGMDGGDRVLTGIRWSTTLALYAMAMRSELKKQAELDGIDDEIMATQRGFEALEDILPRATKVLDHIAVHGTRALKRWDAQMVTRPCQWDSLDSAQKQRFLEFVEISACQLAVASIDVQELMDSRGDERERLIEWVDAVLSKSQEDVEALV